jgi:hypothetical protein
LPATLGNVTGLRKPGGEAYHQLRRSPIHKLENHGYAVALHFMHYNFCRVHKTLRVTPAMQVGLTDHVWTIEELCNLLPEPVTAKSTIEHDMLAKALAAD